MFLTLRYTAGEIVEMEEYGLTPEDLEPCEHGLSSWLCEGPQHYPYDEEEALHHGF